MHHEAIIIVAIIAMLPVFGMLSVRETRAMMLFAGLMIVSIVVVLIDSVLSVMEVVYDSL